MLFAVWFIELVAFKPWILGSIGGWIRSWCGFFNFLVWSDLGFVSVCRKWWSLWLPTRVCGKLCWRMIKSRNSDRSFVNRLVHASSVFPRESSTLGVDFDGSVISHVFSYGLPLNLVLQDWLKMGVSWQWTRSGRRSMKTPTSFRTFSGTPRKRSRSLWPPYRSLFGASSMWQRRRSRFVTTTMPFSNAL